ncbi:hypothetical protein O6H91_Y185800 [Diphasiastrum complanatum]|nr:hypothetical protein O6H91_Y185800 [Diphasiastrum complanatum]
MAIWTRSTGLQWGIIDGYCDRCGRDLDSIQHTFLLCEKNEPLTSFILSISELGFNVIDNISWFLGLNTSIDKDIWLCIRAPILWSLWRWRNSQIFGSPIHRVSLLSGLWDISNRYFESCRKTLLKKKLSKDSPKVKSLETKRSWFLKVVDRLRVQQL